LGGIGKELEWNNIDSYRRKGSLWIQTLYYPYGIEEEEKPKILHSPFDRKINLIYFVPFVLRTLCSMRNGLNSTGSNLWDLRNDKKKKKKRGKKK